MGVSGSSEDGGVASLRLFSDCYRLSMAGSHANLVLRLGSSIQEALRLLGARCAASWKLET